MRFGQALVLLAVLVGACTPASSQVPEETETPTATQVLTPTPTIVWFPPTATPTRFPTQVRQPTPEQRPGLGAVSLTDSFSQTGLWQTLKTGTGSVDYGRDALTVAISAPKAMLSSLRAAPDLNNFYLEITSTASLCRGPDAYGLLLRAADGKNLYRFLVNCSGQVRLERVKNNQVIPLQDWMPSGQVPPGSPLVLRLGVWAVQDEMRFFVNNFYQFSVRDPVWKTGLLGIFARSGGNTAVSVSFSDLVVRSVDYRPVAIATAASPTVSAKVLRPTATPTRKLK